MLGFLLCVYFLHWFPIFVNLNSHWMLFDIKEEVTPLCCHNHWYFPGLSKFRCENYRCSGNIRNDFVFLYVFCACSVLGENMRNKFVFAFCEFFLLALTSLLAVVNCEYFSNLNLYFSTLPKELFFLWVL